MSRHPVLRHRGLWVGRLTPLTKQSQRRYGIFKGKDLLLYNKREGVYVLQSLGYRHASKV